MKAIAKLIFKKSPTVKNYLFVFPDKSIIIRTLILIPEDELHIHYELGDTLLITRFGKSLIQQSDRQISRDTINAMYYLSNVHAFDVPEGAMQTGIIRPGCKL